MYALVTNGAVEKYPYSIGNLRKDNPQVSFPKNPPADALAAFGMLPVTPTERPVFDPIHKKLEESAVIQGDEVVQVWTAVRRDDIPTVDDVATKQVGKIKTGCGQAIEARYPLWRQSNLMARAIELLDIRRDRELTETEAVERDMIEAARDWIARQRAESDRLETLVTSIKASADSDDEKRTAIAALKFVAVD